MKRKKLMIFAGCIILIVGGSICLVAVTMIIVHKHGAQEFANIKEA